MISILQIETWPRIHDGHFYCAPPDVIEETGMFNLAARGRFGLLHRLHPFSAVLNMYFQMMKCFG